MLSQLHVEFDKLQHIPELTLQDLRQGVSRSSNSRLLHPSCEWKMVSVMESRAFDFHFSALTISWPLFITLLKMRHLIKCAHILILLSIGYKPRNACRSYGILPRSLSHHTLLFMGSHNCMLHYELFCWKLRLSHSTSTAGCSLQSGEQTRLLTFPLTLLMQFVVLELPDNTNVKLPSCMSLWESIILSKTLSSSKIPFLNAPFTWS